VRPDRAGRGEIAAHPIAGGGERVIPSDAETAVTLQAILDGVDVADVIPHPQQVRRAGVAGKAEQARVGVARGRFQVAIAGEDRAQQHAAAARIRDSLVASRRDGTGRAPHLGYRLTAELAEGEDDARTDGRVATERDRAEERLAVRHL
jgi:hypothetical protein